jgi:hypothetical protein
MYDSFVKKYSSLADRDLLASALYAKAQIFFSKLNDPVRAAKAFQNIIDQFPASRWAGNSKLILREIKGKQTENKNMSGSIIMEGTGFDTPPDSLPYKNHYRLYDPALLTPDLLIPISKNQWEKERKELEKIQNEPHLSPIKEDTIPTGASVIKKLLSNLSNTRPLAEYKMSLTLHNTHTDVKSRFTLFSKKDAFKIAGPGFNMIETGNKRFFVFHKKQTYFTVPGKKHPAHSLFSQIRDFCGFGLFFINQNRVIFHYNQEKEGFHHINIYYSDQKGPVFFNLIINNKMSLITGLNIHDFNSKKIIIKSLNPIIDVASSPDETWQVPKGFTPSNNLPDEFMLPLIFN